jgi:hypothetical protein
MLDIAHCLRYIFHIHDVLGVGSTPVFRLSWFYSHLQVEVVLLLSSGCNYTDRSVAKWN